MRAAARQAPRRVAREGPPAPQLPSDPASCTSKTNLKKPESQPWGNATARQQDSERELGVRHNNNARHRAAGVGRRVGGQRRRCQRGRGSQPGAARGGAAAGGGAGGTAQENRASRGRRHDARSRLTTAVGSAPACTHARPAFHAARRPPGARVAAGRAAGSMFVACPVSSRAWPVPATPPARVPARTRRPPLSPPSPCRRPARA